MANSNPILTRNPLSLTLPSRQLKADGLVRLRRVHVDAAGWPATLALALALGVACCSHGCSPRQGGGGALAGAREGEAAEGRRARGEARLAGAMRLAIRGAQSGAAPHACRSARAPLTLRPTQASALLQPGRAGCRRGRGARWARRGRHVLHGIGSVASVGPKGRQVASAGRLCRRRRCAEPADRPVLARACGFAGAGSCLLYTSPSPRDRTRSRMPSSA